ncbi:MAG: hypothetical protein WCJ24_02410 [Candidatus Saccharibacteria bacterium]
MKSATAWQAGYTIVETMIFLIISSVLLLSVIGMFSGRTQRTQFTQSVQGLATRITTTSNEVSTGTYPEIPSFDCTNNGGVPHLSTSAATVNQGSRDGCIFIGKIMNFTVNPNCTDIATDSCDNTDIYTVVGVRELDTISHTVVTTLSGAKPKMVTNPVNLTSNFRLANGTRVTGAYLRDSSGTLTLISAVGFFQGFGGSYSSDGNLSSGSQSLGVWYLKPSISPIAPRSDSDISTMLDTNRVYSLGSAEGIVVCLQSGNRDQRSSIGIGDANGALTTNVTAGDSRCAS